MLLQDKQSLFMGQIHSQYKSAEPQVNQGNSAGFH